MAKRVFKSIDEAIAYLEKDVVVSFEKVAEEIKGVLRQYLLTDWYNTYNPAYYDRTDMLINSLEVKGATKVGKAWECEIFFNPEKITPVAASDGKFPAHMNITDGSSSYNGMSYGELLPHWVEHGQHSSIHSYLGIHMVQNTKDWISQNKYLMERMKELLKMKGYEVL